jgi:hypothetical protein
MWRSRRRASRADCTIPGVKMANPRASTRTRAWSFESRNRTGVFVHRNARAGPDREVFAAKPLGAQLGRFLYPVHTARPRDGRAPIRDFRPHERGRAAGSTSLIESGEALKEYLVRRAGLRLRSHSPWIRTAQERSGSGPVTLANVRSMRIAEELSAPAARSIRARLFTGRRHQIRRHPRPPLRTRCWETSTYGKGGRNRYLSARPNGLPRSPSTRWVLELAAHRARASALRVPGAAGGRPARVHTRGCPNAPAALIESPG